MNLAKLAKLAGVSVSTVSKAFSGSAEISETTQNKIFELAREYGCFEKYYKPRYGKKLIAVICPEILGIHYTQMAAYFEQEIEKSGGTMVLSVSNFSAKTQQELLDYYIHFAHADGIIVIEPAGKIKHGGDVPIIQIGQEYASKDVDCVYVDMHTALEEAVRYLDRMGHTKIGYIGETFSVQEQEAFCSVMQKKRIGVSNAHVVVSDKRFYDAGYYGMDALLHNGDLPTVVFAAYSHIATGMLQRLKEEDMQVPRDISIICMDDISTLPYADMQLCCIKMHLDELCAISMDVLNRKLDRRFVKTRQSISVSREFVKGDSVLDLRIK